MKILQAFNWTRVGIVSDSTEVYISIANRLFTKLQKWNSTVVYYKTKSTESQSYVNNEALVHFKHIVKALKKQVCVIICFLSEKDILKMLQIAEEEKMLERYVFLVSNIQIIQFDTMSNGMFILQLSLNAWNESRHNFRAEVIKVLKILFSKRCLDFPN